MVRSLQLVQDRIADGDHAALPMQKKLLEMIDKRLRTVDRDDMNEPRNFRRLLIYSMSGGNPTTLQAVLERAFSTRRIPPHKAIGDAELPRPAARRARARGLRETSTR